MAAQEDVSDDDSQFFRLLAMHKTNLESARARKGEIPTDHEDRETQIEQYRIQYESIQREKKGGFEKTRLQSTIIGEPYLPSVASIRDLSKIIIRKLMLETHHRGRYMLLRVAAPPVRMSAVITVVEDEVGGAATFSLYQQEPESVRPAEDILKEGSVFLLKEPYFKVTGGGGYGIRVDHPTDVAFLSDDDPRVPDEWRLESENIKKTADEWKLEGNALMGAGKHREAIEMYSKALKANPTHAEAEVIHNNRALSFLKLGKYDAALEDVAFVPDIKARSEKALYRGALALYNLRRFKDSLRHLRTLLSNFPDNPLARQEMARVKLRIEEQEMGKYNFTEMYIYAKLRPPHIDCATFIGPVEVRPVEGKGRGLFTINTIRCGDLVACEKAFSYGCAEPPAPEDGAPPCNTEFGVLVNLTTNRVKLGTDAAHIPNVYQKLVNNPSLARSFLDLCHGSYESTPTTKVDGMPVVDSFLIERIVSLNAFGCPVTSKDQASKKKPDKIFKSSGIWPLAAYINHSCIANCARTFIGDMMIIRAAQDLPPNTELTWCYHDPTDREKLQKSLKNHWGFTCSCPVCVDELNTEVGIMKLRKEILNRISTTHVVEIPNRRALLANPKLFSLLDTLFKKPATEIPRYEVFRAFNSEAMYWWKKYNPPACSDFAVKALESLGFVIDSFRGITPRERKNGIMVQQQWGASLPEVAQLWRLVSNMGQHSPAHQRLAVSASHYWRTAYTIAIAGEKESFEDLARAGIQGASADYMRSRGLTPAPVGHTEKLIRKN